MSGSKRSRVRMLAVVAFLLGAVWLLGCQPAQPVPLGTPQTAEKGAAATPTKATEKAAATPAKAVEKPVRGGTLRLVTTTEKASLDPHPVLDQSNGTPVIFESYINLDNESQTTKEGLFKDWTIGPDGKAFTFKLREGVKFHDGTDWDAAAVKFNIERVQDPATKSPFANSFASVASVEVVDNLTARFNLSRPDPTLLVRLGSAGGLVVSPAAVKKYGQDFGRNPVGTGPFQFEKWALGDYISLKRFEGYWRKDKDGNQLPYLDGMVIRIITDQDTAVANLRTGQIDHFPSISPSYVPLIKSDPNLVTYRELSIAGLHLVLLNTKRPPFDNKALREAVALAVHREDIATAFGDFPPHASVMTPAFAGYDPKVGVFPARDLAKAKAKMAEAGYPGGGGLTVKLLTVPRQEFLNANQVLQANLAEIGIVAEIQTVNSPEFTSVILSQEGEAKYRILFYRTPAGEFDVGDAFSGFFHSKGGRNVMGPYSNPEVDKLIDRAGGIYDQKEREALYQKAAAIIREDTPVVPLLISQATNAFNKRVRNLNTADPLGMRPLRDVWLAP